jgi:serine/threonine protein phosphatase 1
VNGGGANGKLAQLRGPRRIWAVGSIHGEAARLSRLHDQIAARFADGDRVVYLGNYLGHGGEVVAAIDELIDFRTRIMARPRGFMCDVVFLRGAQEEMWQKLLQLQFAQNPGEVLGWMARNGIEATVEAYGAELRQGFAASRDGPRTMTRWTSGMRDAMNGRPGHTALFSTLRHAAVVSEGPTLFVSAGINPVRPLAEQGDAFWWGPTDILELTAPFDGFRRVIRGFDRDRRGLVQRDYAVSLDAGAGRGGKLLAAAFAPNGEVLEVLEA